jgi:RsiW-degrading membrane proteinase PrsW (M82 family)
VSDLHFPTQHDASCPHCGSPAIAGARFCAACGRSLRSANVDSESGPSAASSTGFKLLPALSIVLPFRTWFRGAQWRDLFHLAVVVYFLLPSVFLVLYANATTFDTPGWAYALYLAPVWALVFWHLIEPGRLHKREYLFAGAILLGTLIGMNTLTQWWEGAFHLNPTQQYNPFAWIVGVGFAEEVTKALPILIVALLLLRFRRTKLSVKMWMFLGTISGLVFGVKESAMYNTAAISDIYQHRGDIILGFLMFGERIVLDGAQHAVWAGIAAFFIGMGVNHARRRWQLIGFGVTLAAVLHGVNDWQAGPSWMWIGIQALSLLIFLGYAMSATAIERRISETPMFQEEPLLEGRAGGKENTGWVSAVITHPPAWSDTWPTTGTTRPVA